jgi:hypothetical protein
MSGVKNFYFFSPLKEEMSSINNMSKTTSMNPLSFTTHQKWNATVMANIWEKRHILDPGQLSNIKALYDNAKSNGRYNVSTFTYGFSKNSSISRAGYGRLYSNEKGSLERLEKTLRHSLCAGIYWDVDIVNAQPTILSQMAKSRGLKLDFLSYYVSNRDEIINSMMNQYNMPRHEVKDWIIKCIFGSNIPELKQLQNELKTLAKELRDDYTDLYDKVYKTKEKNIIGTFLAYVAQSEECKCLLAMVEYFKINGRDVGVFCYDGCMILVLENETEFPEKLIKGCEKYIFKSTNYEVKLQIKEMKCAEEFSNKTTKLLRRTDIDDVYMTKKFIEKMNGNLINDIEYGIMVFQEDIGFWSNDEDILRKEIINANLIEETMDGNVNYSGFLNKQDIIIRQLPALLSSVNFCETHIDKTIGKLLFKDGIYDMPTKVFTKGFDKNLYFAGRINRNFPEVRDEELIKKINKLLFEDPFKDTEQDVGVYKKQLISRGIAGHYDDKVTIWAIGETNSGKGVQSIALLKCFDTFISTYNPNALLYNKQSGADEAKKLSWVYPIHNSRIAIGNEVRSNGIIDISIVNNLVSGGDLIPIRKNFKDEEYKKNRATLLYFSNDMAKFSAVDSAIIGRIKIYEYKLSFVNKPIEELEQWERQAIPIKFLFDDDEYKNAYFWCIMDAYSTTVPRPCKTALASAKEWIPTPKASFLSCLQEAGYQIVKGDDDVYVPFSELKAVLTGNGVAYGMTDQAIGRELNKLGLDNTDKKINGKTIKVRRFITKKE